MKTYKITTTEAQNNFSTALKLVNDGNTVEFTKYGKIIAIMSAPKLGTTDENKKKFSKSFIEKLEKKAIDIGPFSSVKFFRQMRDND